MSTLRKSVLALVCCAISGWAVPVTLTLTGQVTDDAINGCGGLVNCGAVTITYTFDSAAPDLNADPTVGLFTATAITFSIDGVPFFSSPTGVINVANFAGVDQYGLLASGTADNLSAATLSVLLSDTSAAAFSSDALPQNASALALLLPGTLQLNADDDSFQLLGTIDSASGGPRSSVPEPSSGAILGLGILFLSARRLRR
jgi:hypothetical protein